MKEVLNPKADTMDISLVKDSKFYGLRRGSEKAFVARAGYHRGNYRVLSGSSLTQGNGYAEEPSLQGLLKLFLEGNWQVFEFNTSPELFKWLSE